MTTQNTHTAMRSTETTAMRSTETTITAYSFAEAGWKVRTVTIDGNPHFVAADVCRCLNLSNPSVMIRALDDDERPKYCLGRQGKAWFVTESGLYHLIFLSRKSEARRFRRWVTSEVLPQLRRTGEYRALASRLLPGFSPEGCVDLADTPDSVAVIAGYPVRSVEHGGTTWYSIPGILRALRRCTRPYRLAGAMNAATPGIAVKMRTFGCSSPVWYTSRDGLNLLLAGSTAGGPADGTLF